MTNNRSIGAMLLLTVVLAGCSKNGTAAGGSDRAAGAAATTAAAANLSGDPCSIVDKATASITTLDHATKISTVMNGGAPKASEARTVGGKSYIMINGRWRLSPTNPSEMAAMAADERKTAKETCKALGDETVDGVATAVFSVHVENDGSISDNKTWIAKDTGLPVKTVSDLGDKTVITQINTYKGVVAPEI